MDYSDKIQTHIDALRHYLLAQAETNDPFVSQKDRNERISRDILTVSSARRGMFVNEIPGMNPGFASFLSRFSPVFTLDWNSEFMDEVSMMSRFARPFQIMLNASDESDSRMLSIYIWDKREGLVRDLLSRSVLHYKGDSAPTSDSSPANVEKVNRILMSAVYDSYPKNIAPDDLDGAMVHVIQACDNERRKMLISEYQDYEEFFKAYPYGWSDRLIRKSWETSLNEEIISECDTE